MRQWRPDTLRVIMSLKKKISVTERTYITEMRHMAMLMKNIQHKLKFKW